MPPQDAGGRLQDAEITDLETWIRSGAFDPRTEEPPVIPQSMGSRISREARVVEPPADCLTTGTVDFRKSLEYLANRSLCVGSDGQGRAHAIFARKS